MKLAEAIDDTMNDLLQSQRQVTPDEILNALRDSYSEEIAAESERLLKNAIWKIVRDWTRQEDGGKQQDLPGIGLPKILLLDIDGAVIMRSEEAVLVQLEAGLQIREKNIANAQSRRDRYAEGLDKVRPLMSTDPAMTLKTAMLKLGLWE